MHHKAKTFKTSFPADIFASLVVFLIAVPLSLGIALASGMPAVSAIVSAVVGGIVVGMISGAPLVVTGPAAGLSAMILQLAQSYGTAGVFKIAILAGVIQILLSIAQSARLILRMPKTVVEGVLTAIGTVIVLGQFHILMGQKIPGGALVNIARLPSAVENLTAVGPNPVSPVAFGIGLLTLAVLLSWKKIAAKLAWLPAALPAVIIATLAALSFAVPRMTLDPILPHVQGTLAQVFSGAYWSDLMMLIGPAFGLAIVASAESLLTARSLDVLMSKRHIPIKMKINVELMAQGVGNVIAGVLGGIPVTGVMVRSAANLDAGATSRRSSIMHGVWILLFVLAAPQILAKIPLAALAAVLIVTGIKLISLPHMIHAVRENPREAWVWPATAVAIISTDLLKGLGIGIGAWAVMAGTGYLIKKYVPRPEESQVLETNEVK